MTGKKTTAGPAAEADSSSEPEQTASPASGPAGRPEKTADGRTFEARTEGPAAWRLHLPYDPRDGDPVYCQDRQIGTYRLRADSPDGWGIEPVPGAELSEDLRAAWQHRLITDKLPAGAP